MQGRKKMGRQGKKEGRERGRLGCREGRTNWGRHGGRFKGMLV